MFKRFHAALAALILLASNPALAADNYQVKDATGATLTLRSRDTGNGQSPQFVVGDPAGAAFLTSANPGYFTLSGGVPLPTGAATSAKQAAPGVAGTPSADVLSVQGVAGGTPQPSDTVVRSTSADRGGTITTGGTAQQFMAANASRRGFLLQNQSTGDLYVNCLSTAAANQSSLKIPAGALYESSPHHSGTGACSIFGATTAQAFYSREF